MRTPRLIAFCHVHGASLKRRHNERDGVSNHRRLDYFLNRFYRSSSKKTSKLRVTGLCEGNSPVTGEFPAQRASNTENVSIWWRHHITRVLLIWWYNLARHSMMENMIAWYFKQFKYTFSEWNWLSESRVSALHTMVNQNYLQIFKY